MDIVTTSVATLISWIIVGAIWSAFDIRYGALLRHWLNNMTTKEEVEPQRDERGFIHRRKARHRFTLACTLAVLQSALWVALGLSSPLSQFYSIIFEAPALMLGFYLGPVLLRIWKGKDRYLDMVDKMERDSQVKNDANARDSFDSPCCAEDTNTTQEQEVSDQELLNNYLKGVS